MLSIPVLTGVVRRLARSSASRASAFDAGRAPGRRWRLSPASPEAGTGSGTDVVSRVARQPEGTREGMRGGGQT